MCKILADKSFCLQVLASSPTVPLWLITSLQTWTQTLSTRLENNGLLNRPSYKSWMLTGLKNDGQAEHIMQRTLILFFSLRRQHCERG